MVQVVYDDAFLHDAANLEDYLKLNTRLTESGSGPRDERVNAAGFVRIVSSPGVKRVFDVEFDLCDRDTYEQLRVWADRRLLLRARKVVVYGAFSAKSYTIDHYSAVDLALVSVRFVAEGLV